MTKLNSKEFSLYKKLLTAQKQGKISPEDERTLSELIAKKQEGNASNDVSWHDKYPEYVKSVSNIPFNSVAGEPLLTTGFTTGSQLDIPVGMVIDYVRTIGNSVGANDAYNLQMRTLWLEMHRKYRGLGSYEWPDLGIALFAIMNAFSDIARAERAYGLLAKFNARNRSLPTVLLKALHIDPAYISGDDIANFRAELNRIVSKAYILCLPKNIGAFQAFLAIDSNVFKDSDSCRAAWYAYDARYHATYDATTQGTGGSITFKERTKTGLAYDNTYGATQRLTDIIADLDADFDALLSDTDIARICSDLIACYGTNNLVTLSYVPENYSVDLVRDDTRTMQLHNTTLVGEVFSEGMGSSITASATVPILVYQEDLCVKMHLGSVKTGVTPTLVTDSTGTQFFGHTTATNAFTMNKQGAILDIWKDAVDSSDVIEITRQVAVCNTSATAVISGGSTYYFNELSSFGIILCCRATIWSNEKVNGPSPLTNSFGNVVARFCQMMTGSSADLASALSKFDWHPQVWFLQTGTGLPRPIWDIDNYVPCSASNIKMLHDACILSNYKIAEGILTK